MPTKKLVDERVSQFRSQTERFYPGELPEEQFYLCVCKWSLYSASCANAAYCDSLWLNEQSSAAYFGRDNDYDKGYEAFTTPPIYN